MKEFMMIFIGANYEEIGLSPEQLQDRMGKWFAWTEKLQNQGVLRGGEALTTAGKHISGPDRIISDGPYAESKEIIGGYFVVAADTVDDVVKMAQDFPDYDLNGTVEIREVMKFDNQ